VRAGILLSPLALAHASPRRLHVRHACRDSTIKRKSRKSAKNAYFCIRALVMR
jgi:hypothetical protein